MEKWIQILDYKVKRDNVVLNIGDYIDYHDQAGEDGTDLYEGKWQVLGADDDGNLLIISEENVTRHYFNKENTLEGAMEAYSTGVDTLDKICEVYEKGTGATHARSIRVEDVNRLTGFNKTTDSNYGKIYTIKNNKGDTFIWYDGTNWHKSRDSKEVTLTNMYYRYNIIKSSLPFEIYDMLFGEKNKNYWLGSSYVGADSYYADFGLRSVLNGIVGGLYFVYSNGVYGNYGCGVRAVVTLKQDINITPKVIEWKMN